MLSVLILSVVVSTSTKLVTSFIKSKIWIILDLRISKILENFYSFRQAVNAINCKADRDEKRPSNIQNYSQSEQQLHKKLACLSYIL